MDNAAALNAVSASVLKEKANSKFKKTGLSVGLISGLTYGLFSTFVVVASAKQPLAGAVGLFAAPYVASAINDLIAAIWLLIYNAQTGRIREIGRSLKTFPGLMVILGAILGGPIANGAYLMGLSMAGAYAIPISALFTLFGALFARIILKQKITKRVGFGMFVCVIGAIIINWVKPEGGSNFTLGIICAFIAAIGWGLEGVLAAFGSATIDSDIAVNIREGASGLINALVVLPIIGALGLFSKTFMAGTPIMWLAIAGLCAAVSFLTWYKSNCMVGCAIGMSLNMTYVFFGVVLSILFLGSPVTPTIVIGSLVVFLGALLVSVNPMDFFKKKEA
jgi:drug/metabolite transporter (DMT)-like permease